MTNREMGGACPFGRLDGDIVLARQGLRVLPQPKRLPVSTSLPSKKANG